MASQASTIESARKKACRKTIANEFPDSFKAVTEEALNTITIPRAERIETEPSIRK